MLRAYIVPCYRDCCADSKSPCDSRTERVELRWRASFPKATSRQNRLPMLILITAWMLALAPILTSAMEARAQIKDTQSSYNWDFLYNPQNQLTGIRLPNGAVLGVTLKTPGYQAGRLGRLVISHDGQTLDALEWDRYGRIVAVESTGQRVHYGYDDFGRLNSANYLDASDPMHPQGKPSHEVRYNWDGSSRLAEVRVDQDYWTKYGYDILGRVTQVDSPLGTLKYQYATEKGYDIVGREMPNGVRSQWKFDPVNRPVEVIHIDQKNSVIFQEKREYNPDNTIRNATEWTRQTGSVQISYDYDNMGHLQSVTRKSEQSPGVGQHYEFRYDSRGDIVERAFNGQTEDVYEYSPLGALKGINGVPCRNDRLGLPVELQTSHAAMALGYDPAGRLTSVTEGGQRFQFAHDVFGRAHTLNIGGRKLSIVSDEVASGVRPLITTGPDTEHYWSGSEPIGYRDKTGSRLYLTDLSGKVRVLTGRTGDITDYLEYSPDGQVIKAPGNLSVSLISTGRGRLMDTGTARDLPIAALHSRGIASSLMDLNHRLARVSADNRLIPAAPPQPDRDRDQYMSLPEPIPDPWANVIANALVDEFKWDMISWTAQNMADNPSFSPTFQGMAPPANAAATWIPLFRDAYNLQQSYSSGQAGDPYTTIGAAAFSLTLSEALTGSSLAGISGLVLKKYREMGQEIRSMVLQERAKDLIRLPSDLANRVWSVSESTNVDSGKYNLWGDRMYATASWNITHELFQPVRYEAQAQYGWERSTTNGALFSTEMVDASASEIRTGRGGLLGAFMDDESIQRTRTQTSQTREIFSGEAFNKAWAQYEATGKWEPEKFAPSAQPPERKPDVTLPPASAPEPKFVSSDMLKKKPDIFPNPFDQPWRNLSITPTDVGGVWLRGASKHLDGLGRIKGIAMDEGGRMILLTGADEKVGLPPVRLDDVVTIFRSVYEDGQAPFVSIDPVPENPRGPVMDIRHGKATAATYPGWILFETDRVMKTLGLGYDNLTREKVSSSVEGYKNQFHEDFLSGGPKSEVWERFWIVPASVMRRCWEKKGTRLALLDIPLEVKTQRMKMAKGKLEPVEDPTPTPGAAYFSKWFTSHYNDIAREWLAKPPEGNGMSQPIRIYEELRQIALITAIAEYMRDQGEPMPGWVRDYHVQPFSMPQRTPALLVEEKRQRGNTITTQQIYGGVDLTPETGKVSTITGDKEAKDMGEKLTQTFDRQPPPLLKAVEVELPGSAGGMTTQRVTALALPSSRAKAPGSLQMAHDDVVVMAAGRYPLRLTRWLNSFKLPSGEFGEGWTMGLPRLETSSQVVSKKGDQVIFHNVYNLYSPLGEVNAVFAKEKAIEGKGTFLVDDRFQEAVGLGSAEDKRVGGKARVVVFHDGRRWFFRDDGVLGREIARRVLGVLRTGRSREDPADCRVHRGFLCGRYPP